nr:immunoglobulin heavy chain junction region [Macaca mulatta]MOV53401.1 immunoglobulin heavy chain junction region [Macaca mulatta]MOV53985.1 immunoglobulin heavy chain junction region [Macaca mulatta]MOV55385.1 immunoglobulin heavy chain junction region [Macaca mulatta]MOV55474.1 immunoglobulin heavy chain junction region [Macaca mulatta]
CARDDYGTLCDYW